MLSDDPVMESLIVNRCGDNTLLSVQVLHRRVPAHRDRMRIIVALLQRLDPADSQNIGDASFYAASVIPRIVKGYPGTRHACQPIFCISFRAPASARAL